MKINQYACVIHWKSNGQGTLLSTKVASGANLQSVYQRTASQQYSITVRNFHSFLVIKNATRTSRIVCRASVGASAGRLVPLCVFFRDSGVVFHTLALSYLQSLRFSIFCNRHHKKQTFETSKHKVFGECVGWIPISTRQSTSDLNRFKKTRKNLPQ